MIKTKKPLTLAELREKWSEGGKKRAANLTRDQRVKISKAANKAKAEKRETQKQALGSEGGQTKENVAPFAVLDPAESQRVI